MLIYFQMQDFGTRYLRYLSKCNYWSPQKPVSVKSYHTQHVKHSSLVVCGWRELCDIRGKNRREREREKTKKAEGAYFLVMTLSQGFPTV